MITEQEQVPAADTIVTGMTMNESDLWIVCGGIVHLLQESRSESNIVIRDDPVRTLHVALDHQIPGSAGTDVRWHMNDRDLSDHRMFPSRDLIELCRDLSQAIVIHDADVLNRVVDTRDESANPEWILDHCGTDEWDWCHGADRKSSSAMTARPFDRFDDSK